MKFISNIIETIINELVNVFTPEYKNVKPIRVKAENSRRNRFNK